MVHDLSIMTSAHERELHRLTSVLASIEDKFRLSGSQRTALRKSAICVSLVFIHGLNGKLDEHSKFLAHLDKMSEKTKRRKKKAIH